MYIVGGFNAYPAEIETYLTSYWFPDDASREVGLAIVVLRPM